ncbi:MAG: bifunctional tRNA (5-methylaminomethyl-2-thiouridine)(34)-methyltransferase MnmD/FAD-dependent 5-carboxymethylaminomethyl-2-thiouridine(34) oxidoreductase MnmC [Halioglobus sp.]|nr:bifunctional tRNA (5-methylaminomethyl-2-thiouridine)(34)-methyltransferase MnmD/FAD-dependent 5-carboxymethylaminomethyl-2-thiouridine(34) oxidoreductase MnmC [Halioglobus sp.]
MKRDNLPWQPALPATLRWSDSGVPVSSHFDDVYYSQDNGLEESRHVFLAGSELPKRWLVPQCRQFCIGELGFGTGLNFLLTWQAWRALPQPRPDLHFLSIEKHPLVRRDLERALAAWPALGDLAARLLAVYPPPLAGQHRLLLEPGLRLDLWWEDASDALTDLASRGQPFVDAWYLDGFAPARNDAMWSPQVINAVAGLSRPGASFATFTAAGHVKRKLMDAGFNVSKVPGYGRKRECLRGVLEAGVTPEAPPDLSPWDLPHDVQERPDHILVLGGGLAGCTTAAALAARGIQVTLLEQGALSSGGSGNDQGVLYTRLSRKHSTLVDFALQGFQFATQFYRALFQAGELQQHRDGDLCGSFQQSSNTTEMAALRDALTGLEDVAQVLDHEQASRLLGIEQPCAGYWYPGSGWIRPAAVCRALTARHNIRVLEHCGHVTLHREDTRWHAKVEGKTLAEASVVIVATGPGATAMEQLKWLPLQTIRGQVTELPANDATAMLRAALCHEGYIAPARAGIHSMGASFNINMADAKPRAQDNRDNLSKLAAAVPGWGAALDAIPPGSLQGRVGFRCASPDYLPVVGPVPAYNAFLEDFSALGRNARQSIAHRGSYLPGLYVNTAHGSRGLASTPITAELLASMICDEPLPFSRTLTRALSPARFIIRDLSRNRIRT